MTRNATFYFLNLVSDMMRSADTASDNNSERLQESLKRARSTLAHLRNVRRPEAYEEGLMLYRGFKHAHEQGNLEAYKNNLSRISTPLIASQT